ncbi:MAG: hypothetical protein Q4D74_00655 [Comamonadaceae bacterium]|nr:hypothetical protein [Comamonadaceae bacterium]
MSTPPTPPASCPSPALSPVRPAAHGWTRWPVQACWNVPPAHPALAGHFPGHPIVPGALLLDTAIAYVEAARGRRVRQVSDAKFTLRVLPGQALRLHVREDQGAACRVVIAVQTTPDDWHAAASAQLDLQD